jgi:hypothetical protein
MCVNIPGLKIYGVDPYKQHPQASYVYDAELRHWDEKYLNKMKAKAWGSWMPSRWRVF